MCKNDRNIEKYRTAKNKMKQVIYGTKLKAFKDLVNSKNQLLKKVNDVNKIATIGEKKIRDLTQITSIKDHEDVKCH